MINAYRTSYINWTSLGLYPSENPVLRYQCGFVEPYCRLFDSIENRNTAMVLMRDVHDITKIMSIPEADTDLLKRINYEWTIESDHMLLHAGINGELNRNQLLTIRCLLYQSPMAWSYAMVRHLLAFNDLDAADQQYVRYWLSYLSPPQLFAYYTLSRHCVDDYSHKFGILSNLYARYCDRQMSKREVTPMDYPIHRYAERVNPDKKVKGLGVYIQTCEMRIGRNITYTITEKVGRKTVNREITEPFNEKFLRDIYTPLLRSTVDSIVICIDPLKIDSSEETIARFKQLLLDTEHANSMEPKIYIIIPREHVHAAVGRNMMFSFIRTHLRKSHLLWFGSDDDDKINTEGVNILQSFIMERASKLCEIILFDKYFNRFDPSNPGLLRRYVPWTYAFSPVYYNAISFPCAPIEKEDLDVFNRFMQHPENVINVNDTLIIDPPVYEYQKPGTDRPKHHELYATGDVIDYLNVHNSIESIPGDEQALLFPGSTGTPVLPSKRFCTNCTDRYHYYDLDSEKIRKKCDDGVWRRFLYYGLPSIDDDYEISNKDIITGPSRKRLHDVVDMNTHTDNFNGDLYIVPYEIYTQIPDEPEKLYAIAFQNGKLPDVTRIAIIPNTVKRITGELNELSIRSELRAHSGQLLEMLFEPHTFVMNDERLAMVKQWNDYYLDTYRIKRDNDIPLRTFGGRSINRCLWIIILIVSAIAIIFILCPLIANIKRNHLWKKDI